MKFENVSIDLSAQGVNGSYRGAVFGNTLVKTTIRNVGVTGYIIGDYAIGSLVGRYSFSSSGSCGLVIENCYSRVDLTSRMYGGGLVGNDGDLNGRGSEY